jgi:uncharacterized protein YfdQ (DUF2303 family)
MNQPSNSPRGPGVEYAQSVIDTAQNYAAALVALAGAAADPQNIDGHHYVILPKDFKREDITELVEKAQPTPYRKSGTIAVHDLASLLQYAANQDRTASGYIYADIDSRKIVAVFNDEKGYEPGWRDHRCSFEAKYTPEFKKWLESNRKEFTQLAFAEFVEDNIADLHPDHAQTLLDVATTISAKTDINFSSARRLESGQVQLTYNEVIDAKAGASGALAIPKVFTLGMRVFRNGDGYIINARLKYRLNQGSVKFWYELDRVERVVEDAFAGYVDKLRADSGYTVLLGAP